MMGVLVCSHDERTAEQMAEMAANLVEEMKSREVSFRYKKTDGTLREAVGTLEQDKLPQPKEEDPARPKRTREPNYGVVCYWDVNESHWKSFKVENLISYK